MWSLSPPPLLTQAKKAARKKKKNRYVDPALRALRAQQRTAGPRARNARISTSPRKLARAIPMSRSLRASTTTKSAAAIRSREVRDEMAKVSGVVCRLYTASSLAPCPRLRKTHNHTRSAGHSCDSQACGGTQAADGRGGVYRSRAHTAGEHACVGARYAPGSSTAQAGASQAQAAGAHDQAPVKNRVPQHYYLYQCGCSACCHQCPRTTTYVAVCGHAPVHHSPSTLPHTHAPQPSHGQCVSSPANQLVTRTR